MVETTQVLNDKYAVTTGSNLRGIRAANVREDLRAIYNDVGDISVKRVFDLSADFNVRSGGLEILPVNDVIAVRSEMAVKAYQDKLRHIGLWDRVMGRYPEV